MAAIILYGTLKGKWFKSDLEAKGIKSGYRNYPKQINPAFASG